MKRLLPDVEALARVAEMSVESLENWLLIVHDLPALAWSQDDAAGTIACASLIEVLAVRLLEQDQVSPSAGVSAYLATASAAQIGAGGTGSTGMAQLAQRALNCLETLWPSITATQVQMLFRCPGDVDELAKRAVKQMDNIKDFRAQIAVLNAITEVHVQGDLLAAARTALLRRMTKLEGNTAALCMAEAALRRGSGKDQGDLLVALRSGIFRGVLNAEEVAWCRRPARGYVRYIEESLGRSRDPPRPPTPSMEASEEKSDAFHPNEGAELLQKLAAESTKEPQSGMPGVTWHRGVEGWEVRIEVAGQQILGGYFRPMNGSDQEMEHARLAAHNCRRSLEQQHSRHASSGPAIGKIARGIAG